MRRGLALLVIIALSAACDGGGGETTTLASGPTTTTTEATEVCADLASEAIGMVEDLVNVLNDTRYDELVDRALWSDDLISVEERGAALQAEALAGGCDPGAIQRAVAGAAAELEADNGVAGLLLELISS